MRNATYEEWLNVMHAWQEEVPHSRPEKLSISPNKTRSLNIAIGARFLERWLSLTQG